MDQEAADLVRRLCTLAGNIMEDLSPIALIRSEESDVTIDKIGQAGTDIAALAIAAKVVARRG